MEHVDGLREERDELGRITSLGQHDVEQLRDALHKQHEEWVATTDELDVAKLREKQTARRRASAPEAADQAKAAEREARRAVQQAEKLLQRQRTELVKLASAHLPELLLREPLLSVGVDGIDGEDEVRAVLRPELEFEHFDVEARLSPPEGARHEVWQVSYDGKMCVLKRYVLDVDSEWKALVKEVKLLRELAHCPYIADVEAVFVQQEPYSAFIQLPYYNGGDLLAWLREAVRPMGRRKVLLTHLAHALQDVHERGLAHGDIKLENVRCRDSKSVTHVKKRDSWDSKSVAFGFTSFESDFRSSDPCAA
eukprot:4640480-Prymnesium_polylepis.1